jgi:hypothetical protein
VLAKLDDFLLLPQVDHRQASCQGLGQLPIVRFAVAWVPAARQPGMSNMP